MLYNEGKRVYLTEILKVKNFAGTGIRTHDLPTHWFFIIATPPCMASSNFMSSRPVAKPIKMPSTVYIVNTFLKIKYKATFLR